MQAVILAAGRGSRLGRLTEKIPKALVKVAGKPLLTHVLGNLRLVGIKEVVIVIGYLGELIKQAIGNKLADMTIRYAENPQWEKGNLYSLLAAEKYVNQDFLLCMTDHLFDFRILRALIKSQNNRKGIVTLVIDKRAALDEDTKVLAENNKIVDIGKKIPSYNCVDTGIFLCTPEIFKYAREAVSKGRKTLSECIKLIADDGLAYTFDLDKVPTYLPKMRRHFKPFWIDVDTVEDLQKAEKLLVERASKEPSDLIAKYINKPIENKLVLILAKTSITPNQITIIVNVIAYLVAYLFLIGQLVIGSILTFIVGVLDGVDGKLARIKGMESKIGVLEHPFDMLFECSWYISLALYSFWTTSDVNPLIVCLFILLFIAFYRFIYDQFKKVTGVSLDDYSSFERYFRRIAGRRNLYNVPILIFSLLGAPFYALITILCHAALTAAVYAWRAGKHLHELDRY
ncbi:hypothetical protein DRN86_04230 [Candidatus Geothermarchaeota archaeon]|nr:MAG: hypothetical protein DRN86_04230 [Candidatus Geothermarchaeota archaeon]